MGVNGLRNWGHCLGVIREGRKSGAKARRPFVEFSAHDPAPEGTPVVPCYKAKSETVSGFIKCRTVGNSCARFVLRSTAKTVNMRSCK